ncbi:hypothetical protein MKX03_032741 [Papaver bracteatum]|nr:hypothetical protein MKX03_032741 [Papaver bracteatum]
MDSICKSNRVFDDVSKVHPRRKASYEDLHTWPESDKEFLKSVSLSNNTRDQERGGGVMVMKNGPPRKKKETVSEKTTRCFRKFIDKVVLYNKRSSSSSKGGNCTIVRKVKEYMFSLFRKLLSCSTSVDVVDHHHLSS